MKIKSILAQVNVYIVLIAVHGATCGVLLDILSNHSKHFITLEGVIIMPFYTHYAEYTVHASVCRHGRPHAHYNLYGTQGLTHGHRRNQDTSMDWLMIITSQVFQIISNSDTVVINNNIY